MSGRATPRIFCVEGGWSSRLTNRASVRGLLAHPENVGQIRYTHRQADTVDNVLGYLKRWPQAQYRDYSLGYLGFHGSPGQLHIGRRKLTLEELGAALEGQCAGKTIYFGSCSVLGVPKRRVEGFRRQVRARCVAGYEKDVSWFESSAFDLLLFEALTHYRRIDAVDRWLRKEYIGFVRRLGFKMYYG